MLYLEDYLEMIEHLPQELRDRFTGMRELDLQVQNSTDDLERRVKVFFSGANGMKHLERDKHYQTIRKDYYKTLEDADEKVQMASDMHSMVERYLRRLDQELYKFKMELEADHKGITEILEKRSLELDRPQANIQKGNGRSHKSSRSSQYEKRRRYAATSANVEKHTGAEKQRIPFMHDVRPHSSGSVPVLIPPKATAPATATAPALAPAPAPAPALVLAPTQVPIPIQVQVPVPQPSNLPSTSTNVSYNLGHIGAGGNAIAAAASQAIAATQQMQQGRRTASLKASYEAINTGVHAHELSIGKELAGAAQTAIAAIQGATKKQKKKGYFSSSYKGDFSSSYKGDISRSYKGDFSSSYKGDFSSSYKGDFSGSYKGDFSSSYKGDFSSSYKGDFSSSYKGDFSSSYKRLGPSVTE